MRYVYLLAALAFGAVAPIGAQTSGLIITNYQYQSETRISVNVYDVTYSATLVNTGAPKAGVTARAVSRSSAGDVVVGKDTLRFGPISQNGQVQSVDAFTIRVDRSQTFFFAQLTWSFEVAPSGPTANAGPAQTAHVGDTITLNGSASTSPPGSGTLSYSWALTTKPVGSTAALTNANTVSPTFGVDKKGAYVATLTATNSSGSSTATVNINTLNSAPTASAGPGQSVLAGQTVTLNGSGSTDIDGDALIYKWTMISRPTGGIASTAVLSSAAAVSPTFVADRPGQYVIQLIVNDGTVDSTFSNVTISTSAVNTPPVASAGAAQRVNIGSLVQLSGAASTDIDGDALTYQWSLISLPAGSAAVLSSASAVNPTFTADVDGSYIAQLIVNDGKVNSAPQTVTITTNSPLDPTANAGPDQTVAVNRTVTLAGGGTDPQSRPLTYLWSLLSKPAGSTATLSSTTVQNPTFFADKPGDYVAQLIVNNGQASSQPDTVKVTTTVSAPVANAGAAQAVAIAANVTLSGSASTDPQSLVLTYSWSLTAKPATSTATLTGATTVSPAFVADKVGTYVAQLIVNNGFLPSAPATVTITVNPGPPATIAATAGTPQSANLNAAFSATLSATVRDAQANPVSGATVTFTAPAAGASGSFAGGGITATAVTNASGVATSPVFTANGAFGNYTVAATVTPVASAAAFALTNRSPGPTLTAVGGTPQSVQLRATYPLPLQARMIDATGAPMPGQVVTFNITSTTGGANLTFASRDNTATTDSSGVATSQAMFSNGVIGTITIAATANGVTVSPVYSLSILSGPPQSIEYVSGTGQTAPANSQYTAPFVVIVKDAQSNPVQGTSVTFSAPNSVNNPGGTFAGGLTTIVTNAQGLATSALLSANSQPGNFTVNATVGGVAGSVGFSLINGQPLPNTIAVTSGSPQTSSVGTAFSAPLVATVTTGQNTPAVGLTVSFSAPASGASGTFAGGITLATAVTNGSGVATSPVFTANCTLGGYEVSAAVGQSNSAKFQLTNVPGSATQIAVSAGNNQSAAVTAAFGAPLAVIVKDTCGNPVNNVTVTFTAPATGASGTFATANTATTNAAGIATSNVFTANTTSGAYTVTAAIANVSTPASFSLTNNTGAPATITATSGTPQSAGINAAFASTLGVTVKDAHDNVVPNTTVVFTAPNTSGNPGGTFAPGTVTTNASGQATSTVLTANSKVGTFTVTAAAGAATGANFAMTITSGVPATVTATAGTPQSTQFGAAFATPLQVTVKDAGGNGVANVVVNFAAPSSGATATLSAATANTDANGVASVTATANNTFSAPGTSYNVTATVGALPAATFSLTNLSGPPTTLTLISGSPQSVVVSTAFASRLVAKLTDAGGNPVANFAVTFTVPASGPSGTFTGSATVQTDSNGLATSNVLTANSSFGAAYNVVATVPSVPSIAAVNFSLTNQSGPPKTITITSGGTAQTTAVTTAFGTAFAVNVKDVGGNLLANIPVTFTAPASGATGTFPGSLAAVTVNTGVDGVATAPVFTANSTANTSDYNVVASVTTAGVAPATFVVKNIPGAAANLTSTGTPQTAVVRAAYAAPLTVTVKDAGGNLISGASVTFTAPSTGARATFTGGVSTITVQTNASGVATVNVTAGTVASVTPYVVTATVGALPVVNFSLTNTPGAPASLTVVSGAGQTTFKSLPFAAPLVASVKDSDGNGITGAVVTFAVPASGASAIFTGNVVTATTVAGGNATSAALTANSTVGGPYNVTATTPGVAGSIAFALTNTPLPVSSLTVAGGSGQTAFNGAVFQTVLSASARDVNGEPVPGATVSFSFPASGASAFFAGNALSVSAVTNASGIAVSPTFTANSTSGGFTATASVATVGVAPVGFSLTNSSNGGNCPTCIQLTSASVGKDLMAPLLMTLPGQAPSGQTVTITSLDPSKVLVSSRPNLAGVASLTVLVEGASSANIYVHGVATSGSSTITISGNGYTTASAIATVSPSGFVLEGSNGPGNSFQASATSTTTVTVSPARLDSSLNFIEKQQLRIGVSASVSVTASGGGTITGGSLSFVGGDTSATASFVAGPTAGSATITASVPSGFSTAPARIVNVGITPPGMKFENDTPKIGNNRQTSTRITLQGAAPAGLRITLTSADPSKIKFSKTQSDLGFDSITLNVVTGAGSSAPFYIQGLASSGAVQMTATSNNVNFSPATGEATLTPSGVVLLAPGNQLLFNTVAGGFSTTLRVNTVQVINDTPITQEVAGGQTVVVDLTRTTPSVGNVVPAQVSIPGGSIEAQAGFVPLTEGATDIVASIPPGSIATFRQAVTAIVARPNLLPAGTSSDPVFVGFNLQTQQSLLLGAPAPAGGLQVTLTSSNPAVLLAPDANTPGASSIVITVPASSATAPYYVQSRAGSGTVTYTASAPGFNTGTGTVRLLPSGIQLGIPQNAFNRIEVLVGQTAQLTLKSVMVNGSVYTQQEVSAGISIPVTLSSSHPSATVVSPVVISAGTSSTTSIFTGVSVGGGQVNVQTPSGAGYTSTNSDVLFFVD